MLLPPGLPADELQCDGPEGAPTDGRAPISEKRPTVVAVVTSVQWGTSARVPCDPRESSSIECGAGLSSSSTDSTPPHDGSNAVCSKNGIAISERFVAPKSIQTTGSNGSQRSPGIV